MSTPKSLKCISRKDVIGLLNWQTMSHSWQPTVAQAKCFLEGMGLEAEDTDIAYALSKRKTDEGVLQKEISTFVDDMMYKSIVKDI